MRGSISIVDEKPPKVRTKTSEEIQAQIAAYATEKMDDPGNRDYALENLVDLAFADAKDDKRITEEDEYNYEKEGELVLAGTERTLNVGDYTEFLRSVGGSKYEAIKGRAEILEAYKDFASEVRKLNNSLMGTSVHDEHKAFLANGSKSSVFLIEKGGKKYVVRAVNRRWAGDQTSPDGVDHHLAAAFLSKGVPHLEQIVAASYEDGVTVAELMPGAELGKLTMEDIQSITDEQLAEFVGTLSEANRRGIHIDRSPSNFFYDQDEGFGVIDFTSTEFGRIGIKQSLGRVLVLGDIVLSNMGRHGQINRKMITIEEYVKERELSQMLLEVGLRYRNIVENKLEGEERDAVIKIIDEGIRESEEAIAKLGNPEQVATFIEEAKQRIKEVKERKRTGEGRISI